MSIWESSEFPPIILGPRGIADPYDGRTTLRRPRQPRCIRWCSGAVLAPADVVTPSGKHAEGDAILGSSGHNLVDIREVTLVSLSGMRIVNR